MVAVDRVAARTAKRSSRQRDSNRRGGVTLATADVDLPSLSYGHPTDDSRDPAQCGQLKPRRECRPGEGAEAGPSPWDHARVFTKVNVAGCDTQLLYERGKFQTTYHDLTEAFGARVIGATVFETAAGYTRGPYHFHDGVEEWMYVVSGEPVLRDPSGERALGPGSLVVFQAGPDGAHTFHGPGRVVMFSVGARGWGEAFTSVYLDADKIAASRASSSCVRPRWRLGPSPLPSQSRQRPRARARRPTCCHSQSALQISPSACTPRLGAPSCTSSARATRPASTTTTGAASTGHSWSAACRRCATLAART